jgi:hypothetical protein
MALVTRDALWAAALLRVLAGVLASATVSCGDALVDETYRGAPRFTVRGSVMGTSEYVDEEHPEVSIAVLWSPRGAWMDREATLLEQQGTSRLAEYYRPFELHLFDEPGAEHLYTTPSGARYGIARLGAYQDENRNGRRDALEPLIGSSPGRALIRAPKALTARDSPTGAPLTAGWHIVSTPLLCPSTSSPPPGGNPGPVEPVADGECGVPIGAECRSDADCGGGVCVREFIGPWPGGACLIPEPPPNGCRQRGSVLLRDPQESEKAFWVKACAVTADCGRVAPIQCDQQIRGCRPSADFPVEMDDRPPPSSFCQSSGGPPPPP